MANFILSPNMSLPVPVTGVDPGPDYANNVNAGLGILDGHTHAAGSGVLITPAAININADLSMAGNSLTVVESVNFQPVTSLASTSRMYMIGVDLYFNDGSGNVIRITQSGSVSGASGTITGLPSGTASAAYGSGTFTFSAATNTPANVVMASAVLGLNSAGTNTLTLSPPSALSGGSYSLFLPTIPAQTNVMTLDSSGNMSSVTYDQVAQNMTVVGADAIAGTMDASGATGIFNKVSRPVGSTIGDGGVALSPNSGLFTTTSSNFVGVVSATLSTAGKPVVVALYPFPYTATSTPGTYGSGFSSNCFIQVVNNTTGNAWSPSFYQVGQNPFTIIDDVGAGTYTYSLQVASDGGTARCANVGIVAYEL